MERIFRVQTVKLVEPVLSSKSPEEKQEERNYDSAECAGE